MIVSYSLISLFAHFTLGNIYTSTPSSCNPSTPHPPRYSQFQLPFNQFSHLSAATMVPSPMSPQQHAQYQATSEAVARYHKLQAQGHFAPTMRATHPTFNERQYTPVGQFHGPPGPLSPAGSPQQRAPPASPMVSSPKDYYYKPTEGPLRLASHHGMSAAPTVQVPQYCPPRSTPPGAVQTVPRGWTPSPVATSSPHTTSPHASRSAFPNVAPARNGSHMPTISPYATNSYSPYTAPATNTNNQEHHVQQPKYAGNTAHNDNKFSAQPQVNYGASAAHMPWLGPTMPSQGPIQQTQYQTQYQPPIQPYPPPQPSISFEGLCKRIRDLLHDTLPPYQRWEVTEILTLSANLANQVISLGKRGSLGPAGLSCYSDIFVVVGYEGSIPNENRYMALAVMAPDQLKILLRTGAYACKGMDVVREEKMLAHLRQGFHNVAVDALMVVKRDFQGESRGRQRDGGWG